MTISERDTKSAEHFDFAAGSLLAGDELQAYIDGLPPRAALLFAAYEPEEEPAKETIAETVVKVIKKVRKKRVAKK